MSAQDRYIRLRMVEALIKELQEERSELIAELVPNGNSTFLLDGQTYTAKIKQRSRMVVNLPRLKALNASLFEKVTKPVIDTTALNRSLDAGEWFDDALREEVLSVVDDRPYIQMALLKEEVPSQ